MNSWAYETFFTRPTEEAEEEEILEKQILEKKKLKKEKLEKKKLDKEASQLEKDEGILKEHAQQKNIMEFVSGLPRDSYDAEAWHLPLTTGQSIPWLDMEVAEVDMEVAELERSLWEQESRPSREEVRAWEKSALKKRIEEGIIEERIEEGLDGGMAGTPYESWVAWQATQQLEPQREQGSSDRVSTRVAFLKKCKEEGLMDQLKASWQVPPCESCD